MTARKTIRTAFYCAAAAALLPSYASAYLDPGTGSFVFQALAAALLGAVFALKSWHERIMAFLRGLLGRLRK